jgi:hypothetical protein
MATDRPESSPAERAETDQRIADIRARLEQASKGPWRVAPRSSDDEIANVVSDYEVIPNGARANWIAELDASLDFDSHREDDIAQMVANAEFIAHARQDIPYLLDLLVSLQGQQASIEATVAEIHKGEDGDGPLESTDLWVRGRGIGLLLNVLAWQQFTYSLRVDGKHQAGGTVGQQASREQEREPSAWSTFGDGHDYSRTGKHDPLNCRPCLREQLARLKGEQR